MTMAFARIMTRQGLIYLVGVMVFGLFYYPLRDMIANDALFIFVALLFAIGLRVIGWLWGRAASHHHNK